MARKIQRVFVGHVSKTMLLTVLLPLSIVSYFGTLIAAAFSFPVPYDWRLDTISSLASPTSNPGAYWIPSVGIALATILALPFAGYVKHYMRDFSPRIARVAGAMFGLGFILLFLAAIIAEQDHPMFWWQRLHERFARSAAAAFFLGMICCCIGAVMDRFRVFGGRRFLGSGLSRCWMWGTLLPIGCGMFIGVLQFLDRGAKLAWANQFRHSFKHTIVWHLAFWEWAGSLIFFAFMFLTILLLPGQIKSLRANVSEPVQNQGAVGDARAGYSE